MRAIEKTEQLEITLDPVTHVYRCGLVEYVSVSKVIRTLWPIKKTFDGVDPAIIENAKQRGILVDQYCCELIRTGEVTTAADEREDVLNGVRAFERWCRQQDFTTSVIETQKILADHTNLIAGTADLVITDAVTADVAVLDIKTTAREEADWPIQVGAYASMIEKTIPVVIQNVAVLHIYKDTLRVRKYVAGDCIRKWSNLVAVWNDTKHLLKVNATDGSDK